MRISYDLDGTLDRGSFVQSLAASDVTFGNDVYIVTGRNIEEGQKAYDKAKQLGIKDTNVIFTNGYLKGETIASLNIDKHYDDTRSELDDIKKFSPGTKTILVNSFNSITNY